MNEWMNELNSDAFKWMNEWIINEWVHKWTDNERINELMNE